MRAKAAWLTNKASPVKTRTAKGFAAGQSERKDEARGFGPMHKPRKEVREERTGWGGMGPHPRKQQGGRGEGQKKCRGPETHVCAPRAGRREQRRSGVRGSLFPSFLSFFPVFPPSLVWSGGAKPHAHTWQEAELRREEARHASSGSARVWGLIRYKELRDIGSPVTTLARDQEGIYERYEDIRMLSWFCCPQALLQFLRGAGFQPPLVLAIYIEHIPILVCLLVCQHSFK